MRLSASFFASFSIEKHVSIIKSPIAPRTDAGVSLENFFFVTFFSSPSTGGEPQGIYNPHKNPAKEKFSTSGSEASAMLLIFMRFSGFEKKKNKRARIRVMYIRWSKCRIFLRIEKPLSCATPTFFFFFLDISLFSSPRKKKSNLSHKNAISMNRARWKKKFFFRDTSSR